ncbi:hypothetical protein JCM8097_002967 [Rhodosporidiobolus ruineniae]
MQTLHAALSRFHLIANTNTAKMEFVPTECKAYNFEEMGGELKLQMRQVPQLKDHEVLIKVSACAMNSTDEIARYDLLDMKRFAITPGCNVAGTIVKLGKNVSSMSHKLKEGQHVVAFPMYGGMSEYCVADAMYCCPMSDKLGMTESCLAAYNCGRIMASMMQWQKKMDMMTKEEKMACDTACMEMGFKGEGVLCVFGCGGQAKVACDAIKAMQAHMPHMSMVKNCRLVLITPNDRWSPSDYGMRKDDVLVWGQCNVREELMKMGGVWCTRMPETKAMCMEMMCGMRMNSCMMLMNPGGDAMMQLPMGPMLVKSISVCGAPMPTSTEMLNCLDMCEKAKIHVDVDCVDFMDESRVREMWRCMEKGESFEAPMVMME